MDLDSVSVHKQTKKERGRYQAILTEQAWSIKDSLYGFWGNFYFGTRRVVPSGQGSSFFAHSGSQSQRRIWFILPAHGASHIIIKCIILSLCLGSRDRTLDTENKTKEDCNEDATGIRRVVQYVYNDPGQPCYTQFFVGGQPPAGLRGPNNGNIRYICQPPTPDPQQPQNTMYATMFDENQGIAVFAAYTLTKETVIAHNRHPHPWCRTPGK